ncbi:hypothetical protein KY284_024952 [Solanum tuberosum]|nr:hypothetical protein KY284_024952 [Solanum tuberosum]
MHLYPPMPFEVQIVIEKDEDENEVTEIPKDDIEKEAERLVKKIEEAKYHRFIVMLNQLSINVPLIEAFKQMPGYVKFMKVLVTKKRDVSFENEEKPQHCSVIATRSLVQNEEDPGAFTIPCTIGILHFAKALCDLGGIPIILGRPFLATARALVDMERGKMKFQLNNEKRKSEVSIEESLGIDALAAVMMNFDSDGIDDYDDLVTTLDSTLPIIIVAKLSEGKIESQISVLKRFKRALGWTIADIIGILLGIFSHKSQLIPDSKPSTEHQTRLNPPMQEVQCVPKKGGFNVVPNAKNELVPMRSVTSWRVCMHYRKLNAWTEKDHFPMLCMDQMLDRLVGDSFDDCLTHLAEVLKGCEECNLVLNWEKCHFMVKEGIVLGHWISQKGIERQEKILHPIYYAIKALNVAQKNYTVTEYELLVVVSAFDKFRSYLFGTKVIVHTDHLALRYLMAKEDAKPRLIRWVLLLQEFNFEVNDRKGTKNQVADHFSRLEEEAMIKLEDGVEINDAFSDQQCGYYWPTIHQNAHDFTKSCDHCQHEGEISGKHELPMNPLLVIELLDVWGLEFMGLYVSLNGMKYILVAVDYVSKWVEAVAVSNNEGKSVTVFLKKNIFSRFGTPREIIVDGELEHKAMWALKKLNLDWGAASIQRMNEMNDIDEFFLKEYESSALYQEKMKR